MILSAIVAADEENGIGKNNGLMWHLPNDLKFFKNTTRGHAVIMGRKTYESMGKALPKRTNIVITGQEDYTLADAEVCHTIDDAIAFAQKSGDDEVFIIGGGNIYRQSMHLLEKIYFTRVHHSFDAEVFFPVLDLKEWKEVFIERHEKDEKHAYNYTFHIYERARE